MKNVLAELAIVKGTIAKYLFEKGSISKMVHLRLSFFTVGLWVPIWMLVEFYRWLDLVMHERLIGSIQRSVLAKKITSKPNLGTKNPQQVERKPSNHS